MAKLFKPAELASASTAVINKGGLSFELHVNGTPAARVRLDTGWDADGKRELIAAIAHAVNHAHGCAYSLVEADCEAAIEEAAEVRHGK